MQSVPLGETGVTTSRLGFGTSRLHYVEPKARRRLLACAYDHGIRHFDTAPSYGDGLAERELGRFVKTHRADVVIATKVGIPPSVLVDRLPALGSLARAARLAGRRVGISPKSLPPITANGIRTGVEASLRRLGLEDVDILFLHSPSVVRLADVSGVLEELGSLKRRGLIRAFGVAGGWDSLTELVSVDGRFDQAVVQTAESEWDGTSPPQITYGAISQGPQSFSSPSIPSSTAHNRLRAALERRPAGVVLVSSTSEQNLINLIVRSGSAS